MNQTLPSGVMLNAYPDSIGATLSDIVEILKKPELKDTFSLLGQGASQHCGGSCQTNLISVSFIDLLNEHFCCANKADVTC